MSEDKIFEEIRAEREYQNTKWGTENDDRVNTPMDWVGYIAQYSTNWMSGGFRPYPKHVLKEFRTSMIKVAALGVAAVAWVDRILSGQNNRQDVLRTGHRLMENLEASFRDQAKYSTASNFAGLYPMLRSINERLIERGLYSDADLYVTAPIGQIVGRDGFKHIVECKTRKVSARFTMQAPSGETPSEEIAISQEEAIIGTIVEEIYAELNHEQTLLAKQGIRVCPYIVVSTSGVTIDPITYEPVVTFLTRYATTDQ